MQLLLTIQNLSVVKSLLFSIFDTFLEIHIMSFYQYRLCTIPIT